MGGGIGFGGRPALAQRTCPLHLPPSPLASFISPSMTPSTFLPIRHTSATFPHLSSFLSFSSKGFEGFPLEVARGHASPFKVLLSTHCLGKRYTDYVVQRVYSQMDSLGWCISEHAKMMTGFALSKPSDGHCTPSRVPLWRSRMATRRGRGNMRLEVRE